MKAGGCWAPRCRRPVYRSGLCGRHHYRWSRYRDLDMSEWATACEDDVALAAEQRRMPDGMTRLERKRLGVALTDRGLIAADAARITGVTPRTIARWRAERRARVRDLTSEAV